MQISSTQLFGFVEGVTDRYFYSRLIQTECASRQIRFEIVPVREIAADAGGKQAMLDFFAYLRRRKLLVHDFKGKITVAAFLFDKDIEDLLASRKRSAHVIYTEHYELENYMFIHGNLANAAAAAACLDLPSVEKVFSDSATWRSSVANRWKDWVKLCVLAQISRSSGAYYRRVRSEINASVFGPVDQNEFNRHLASIQASAANQSKCDFKKVSARVDEIYSSNQQDRVFKGKWYREFAVNELVSIARGRQYQKSGVADRLLSSLSGELDITLAWTAHFRRPLQTLLSLLP